MVKGWTWGFGFIATLILAGFLLVNPFSSSPDAATAAGDVIPGRYIVVLRQGVDPAVFAAAQGVQAKVVYSYALNGFAAPMSEAAAAALSHNPNVRSVEPDRIVSIDLHGNAYETLPTGVDRIDAEEWDGHTNTTGNTSIGALADIDIAILDTGIDDDFPLELRVAGGVRYVYNTSTGTCDGGSYDDDHYHGTHVAGTAAAIDNDRGVVGVAPGARLWAVKVLNSSGSGAWSCIIAGVDWVTANAPANQSDPNLNIEVANMSLGGGTNSALCTAIGNSTAAGVVYAVAAGNSGVNASTTSPANCSSVIAVSAIADSDGQPGGLGSATSYGADDTFASFSNYGSVVDIAAPGVNIVSTSPGGLYRTLSGTSMASPHVAGAVARFKLATGYSGSANGPDVVAAMTAAGWTVEQSSACGFTGDPDAYPEPMLFWTGTSCGSGPDTTPPAAPTITDSDSDSPANDNNPEIKGTAEAGSTVNLYTNNTCTSAVAASGSASTFASPGLTVTVADNTSTTFYATATDAANNVSACSSGFTYVEDSTPPAAPTITDSDPDSPANDNNPEIKGTAEAGSTVNLYTNNTCTSAVAASGSASTFASPGLTVTVADNTSTTFYATATDAANNVSACSSGFTYVEESPPATPVLYFSLQSDTTLSGLSVANEDIVAWDSGGGFSLYFDGSAAGLSSSLTIDAFDILGDGSILMSFTADVSSGIPGLGSVDDSDVVQYTPGSGFSLYFDGSDVGLTTSSEDVDAVHRLTDGRLLVSTYGSFSVNGIPGGYDEDIIAFTPTSLGENTAGAWSMYFDGSDVGLSATGEDVDGLSVATNGDIYLSTFSNFSATGTSGPTISGADEDVFVFTPTALGSTTTGSYASALFFDGSLYGLSSNDVVAIDLP